MATVRTQRRFRRTTHPRRSTALDGMLMDPECHPHLWLTEDNQDVSFRELLQSVRCKRNSLSEISIYNILSRFSKLEIIQLYNTVAELPHLENFSVWASQALTLPVLTTFLQKAQNLEQAAFNNIEVHSLEGLCIFSETVLHHPKLKRLSLENIQIMVDDVTIDVLLKAASQKPKLESLRLSSPEGKKAIVSNSDSLVRLCRSSSLKELFFWGIPLTDENVIRMAEALKLQTGDQCQESKLSTLGLRKCGPTLTEKGYEALVHMLQQNFCLKSIYLDPSVDADIRWRVNFYLYLNQSGTRQALLKNPNTTRETRVDLLALHSDDLNALFYLLEESGATLFRS